MDNLQLIISFFSLRYWSNRSVLKDRWWNLATAWLFLSLSADTPRSPGPIIMVYWSIFSPLRYCKSKKTSTLFWHTILLWNELLSMALFKHENMVSQPNAVGCQWILLIDWLKLTKFVSLERRWNTGFFHVEERRSSAKEKRLSCLAALGWSHKRNRSRFTKVSSSAGSFGFSTKKINFLENLSDSGSSGTNGASTYFP